jgi:hypothetical protein
LGQENIVAWSAGNAKGRQERPAGLRVENRSI